MSKYLAGYNQPGYLPENEPSLHGSFIAAKATQQQTAEIVMDTLTEEDAGAADAWDRFAAELAEQTEPFELLAPDGYVVWVMEAEDEE